MFIKLFCQTFLTLGLNTCLNGLKNYRYIYQTDLTPFKCVKVVFCTSVISCAFFEFKSIEQY